MTKYSVIVPIYNVEPFLKQCVDSVLNQTYTGFEIILVDDGSPDNCGKICDLYKEQDKRVKVVHKVNGGVVSARNAGVRIADGEYIICLDGDDWVDPTMLESFNEIIEQHNPDVVCCGTHIVFEDKTTDHEFRLNEGLYLKEEIIKEIYPSLIQSSNAKYFAPSVWAKAYRKEIFKREQLLVDNRIKIGEDGACVIPIIHSVDSLYSLKKCLYNYRQNGSSMTRSHRVFDTDGPKLIADHISSRIDLCTFDFQQQMYRKVAHELFTVLMSQFNQNAPQKLIYSQLNDILSDPFYSEAVSKATFDDSLKARLMVLCLKKKWFRLMGMVSKVLY